MRTTMLLLGVGVLAMVSGCGGAASHGPAMSPTGGGYGSADAPAGQPGYATSSNAKSGDYAMSQPSAPPPPATAMGEASQSAPSPGQWNTPEPAPQDRPGLGTQWGEARESRIEEVSFFRADPSRPFAVASLNYNDWQGVQALASFHGGPRFHDVSEAGGAITVSIRNAYGEPLDAMHVGERTYVIGHEGERYSIVIENHTPRSFEAVATVDGLDVMNGKTGSFDNRGYVLMPWANLEIDGFRQSTDAVAAFRFSKVKDSYAADRGDARNVGVIGVAFFAQRGDDWSSSELRTRDTASPFPRDSRFAPPPR
jgi:hypothetical protein